MTSYEYVHSWQGYLSAVSYTNTACRQQMQAEITCRASVKGTSLSGLHGSLILMRITLGFGSQADEKGMSPK